MFIKLTNENGDEILVNMNNVTIIKPYNDGSKFYLTDGGYGICQESLSEVIEKINQV